MKVKKAHTIYVLTVFTRQTLFPGQTACTMPSMSWIKTSTQQVTNRKKIVCGTNSVLFAYKVWPTFICNL